MKNYSVLISKPFYCTLDNSKKKNEFNITGNLTLQTLCSILQGGVILLQHIQQKETNIQKTIKSNNLFTKNIFK